jgi:hypothetical protein
MANPYVYYVLTFDGASLMAQATATNQIVFVGAISKATAASSDEDLASKGKSWYDGKTGEIDAVSATDAVAKIVCIFTASGARQDAKSVAITARLASQSDADAVVFCAKSDPDATAILPGSTDTMADVRFPFNISINAAGTVAVTPGASASLADLARFVSMHRAGDPTQGEAQTIHGAKTFADPASFTSATVTSAFIGTLTNVPGQSNIVVSSDLSPANGRKCGTQDMPFYEVRADNAYIGTARVSTLINPSSQGYIQLSTNIMPTAGKSIGDDRHYLSSIYSTSAHISTVYASGLITESSEINITAYGNSSRTYYSDIYIFCDDQSNPGVVIKIKPDGGSESQYNFDSECFFAPGKDLGYAGGGQFGTAYLTRVQASEYAPPIADNGMVRFPSGTVFLMYITLPSGSPSRAWDMGTVFDAESLPAGITHIGVGGVQIASGGGMSFFADGPNLTSGTYRLLSGAYSLANATFTVAIAVAL